MKNLKKVLALVMAFAMAFTMMAGAAYTDQDDIQATDAVELLATLNVMTGKGDGMFHPNDTITRAEICRIIYTIRNEGNDNANAYADMQTSFQDLTSADDWAKGYIKHCQSVGLISGRNEAGTVFGPQDPVTGVELAVICLRVLGYDPAKAGIGGESWSTRTVGLANEAGLLKNVNMESVTGPCERQWAAQIMANMLDARTVRWSADGDRYTIYAEDGNENNKVGREYMKLHTSVGTLIDIDGGNLDIVQNKSDIADSDGAYEISFTNVDTDYTELLGQKVKVLYYDGKANSVIGVYALEGNTVYTVNANAVESDENKVKFDGKSYAIESAATSGTGNISAYYVNTNGSGISQVSPGGKAVNFIAQTGIEHNGTRESVTYNIGGTNRTIDRDYDVFTAQNLFDNWNTSSAIMKFVDSDDNGRLDSVIITDYAAAEVTSASSTKIVAGKTYNHSDENIDENIAQDDWVSISWNRFDDCRDIKKIDVTSAKLSALKKDSRMSNKARYNEYQIDSTWYKEAYDNGGTLAATPFEAGRTSGKTDINTVKAADNVNAVILNGVIWKIKRAGDGTLSDVTGVAMVVNKENGIGGKQVKLQFFNDTSKVVDVDTSAVNKISWDALVPGELYEYSVTGDKYTFDNMVKTPDFYGDFTCQTTNATGYTESTASYARASYDIGSDKIGSMTIDDRAKVILFVKNTDTGSGNETKVITGKQLKALRPADLNATDSVQAHWFSADVSGLKRAAALAMQVKGLPETTNANNYYAYILSDAVETLGSDEISYDVLLQSGETKTVHERGGVKRGERVRNTLIGYKTLSSEDVIDDVKLYEIDDPKFGLDAIRGTDSYGKVQFLKTTEKKIVSDTVIFYVNAKDDPVTGEAKTGVGTVDRNVKATTKGNDIAAADVVEILDNEDSKYKMANALYLYDVGDELDVLVVALRDEGMRGHYVDATKGASVSVDRNVEVTRNAASNYSKNFDLNTRNIPDGATLAVSGLPTGITSTTTNVSSNKATVTLTIDKDVAPGTYDNIKVTVSWKDADKVDRSREAITSLTIVGAVTTLPATIALNSGTLTNVANVMTADGAHDIDALKTQVDLLAYSDTSAVDVESTVKVGDGNYVDTRKIAAGDVIEITMNLTAKGNNVFAANDEEHPITIPDLVIDGTKAEKSFVRNSDTELAITYKYTAKAPRTAQDKVNEVIAETAQLKDATKLATALPSASWGTLATQLAAVSGVNAAPAAKTADNAYTIALSGAYTKAADTNTKWEGFDPATYNTQDYFVVPLTFKVPEGAAAAKVTFPKISKTGVDSDFVDGNLVVAMAIPTADAATIGTVKIQWLTSTTVTDTMGSEITYSFTKAANMVKNP